MSFQNVDSASFGMDASRLYLLLVGVVEGVAKRIAGPFPCIGLGETCFRSTPRSGRRSATRRVLVLSAPERLGEAVDGRLPYRWASETIAIECAVITSGKDHDERTDECRRQ